MGFIEKFKKLFSSKFSYSDSKKSTQQSEEMKCDICSAIGKGTIISSNNLRDVVKKGFNPFKECNLSHLNSLSELFGQSKEVAYNDWKSRLAGDTTDWNICSNCLSVIDRYSQRYQSNQSIPEYKQFITDNKTVQFNYPETWFIDKIQNTVIYFYDKKPPEESYRLVCQYGDFKQNQPNQPSLNQLIELGAKVDKRKVNINGDIIKIERKQLEIAWAEFYYIAPDGNKAYSRICMGRGLNIQVLFTLDYLSEDAESLCVIWDEIMQTLILG